MKRLRQACAQALLVCAGLAALAVPHAAAQPARACYVRVETDEPLVTSYLGMRRSKSQLFDVDISISLPGGANCSVSGVARLRGEPGRELLAFPLRPDPSVQKAAGNVPCQVFVQLTSTALVLATSDEACKPQPPCGGLLDLNGQRFDLSGRVEGDAKGPCFQSQAFGPPRR